MHWCVCFFFFFLSGLTSSSLPIRSSTGCFLELYIGLL